MDIRFKEIVNMLFHDSCLHETLQRLMERDIRGYSLLSLDLIDKGLLDKIKYLIKYENESIYFGKTLRDLKCIIQDGTSTRKHEIIIRYEAPKTLVVSTVNLPYSSLQDKKFKTLEDVITSYKSYVNNLSSYFYELDKMDSMCTVMEPKKPTYKDSYRRILLDDRIWLHVEVTPQGLATNIHLVTHSDIWHNRLQLGLLTWDHDKDIVENVMTIFDINEFPTILHNSLTNHGEDKQQHSMEIVCGICLCDELPDTVGLPLPLCQNPICGVYFHRSCLYQWLVASSGSRPPAFGVATGACPTCLQPIACSENDK